MGCRSPSSTGLLKNTFVARIKSNFCCLKSYTGTNCLATGPTGAGFKASPGIFLEIVSSWIVSFRRGTGSRTCRDRRNGSLPQGLGFGLFDLGDCGEPWIPFCFRLAASQNGTPEKGFCFTSFQLPSGQAWWHSNGKSHFGLKTMDFALLC